MPRTLLCFLCGAACLFAGGRARAASLDEALAALAAAPAGQSRVAAAGTVIELGPRATDALIARLGRARAATPRDLRAVLARFRAEVPDDRGTFRQPPRPPKGGPPPAPDWLAEIAAMDDAGPAVLEALEVVTLIRALAASRQERAADAILDFSFTPYGLVFRDECGRQLRAMSPISLPSLLRASADRKRAGGSYGRYATYQLDRLEKGRPEDALAAAPDDALEVAMLRAVGESHHPDAVYAVMARVNDPSHAVRRAAREAWLGYVTGPEPPPAPRRPRKLPGGKMSEPLPVYLTYRELAIEEVRRVLTEARPGNPPAPTASAEDMTRELFALLDEQGLKRWDEPMAEAGRHVAAGRWAEAVAIYDAILVEDPLFARRAEMAPAFRELGRTLAAAGDWSKAILALDQALSLDPAGPLARDVEAELHLARARRVRAGGQDGDAEIVQALAHDPGLVEARALLKQRARERSSWRLIAGGGAGGLALVLLAVGLVRHRRGRARAERG